MGEANNMEELERLVVIEGLDCTGKTTVARLLEAMLIDRGISAMYNKAGEGCRQRDDILSMLDFLPERYRGDGGQEHIFPNEQAFCKYLAGMLADRSNIEQGLKRNIVIQDRYFFSLFAYYAGLRASSPAEAPEMPDDAKGGLIGLFTKPDLIVYLTASEQVRRQRWEQQGKRGVSLTFDDMRAAEAVHKEYLSLISAYPNIQIDTTGLNPMDVVKMAFEKLRPCYHLTVI